MSPHPFRLPPLADLISSASTPSSQLRPFDPWPTKQPPPAKPDTDGPSTPPLLPAMSPHRQKDGSIPSWKTSSSPRQASSPSQNQRPLSQTQRPSQSRSQQSPAIPFTPQVFEFPRNHGSPMQSRASTNLYTDQKAPPAEPITARQDSAVPERELVATSQPQAVPTVVQPHLLPSSSSSSSSSSAAAAAAVDLTAPTSAPTHDTHAYLPRLLSPAPSPEHVSPLSNSRQRRKTSPPPSRKTSTLGRSAQRSRAYSDPRPDMYRNSATARRVKCSHGSHHASMPPPSHPVRQDSASGIPDGQVLPSLQSPADITHVSDKSSQLRCLSCHDVWTYTQPNTQASSKAFTSGRGMIYFANSMLDNLSQQIKAKDEQFRQWKNLHILEPIDGGVSMPCRAVLEAKGSKRKPEAPLDDALVHAKLRRLSVDSPKASQLTPPPEPSSSRAPLYKFETESGVVAELDENVAVLLKVPGVRPHYEAPSDDASNMWVHPKSRRPNGEQHASHSTVQNEQQPAPKTP